ncbi:TniQ family protein [Kitasatospora sp. NPDC087315]|uniref:TniQ family protein n=1 Tax=Kitasatospora sp. NPDC087315 TaxID=3364069 RepID=UPI0038288610
MTADALGRSLAPLDDESLPGYVLRLSYRLGITPNRLMLITGLHHHPDTRKAMQVSARRLLTLNPVSATDFAAAARLTPQEVAALLLDEYASRYSPLAETAQFWADSGRRITPLTQGGWIQITSTRFCPQCLAGDGSPVQDRLGGPWLRRWRLQVVFACPTHRRLLHHFCPHCESAGTPTRPGRAHQMITRAGEAGLHPAQCRQDAAPGSRGPACGGWLSDPAIPVHPADRAVLRCQERILERLHPTGPVPASEAVEYFTLLGLVHELLVLTWPMGRALIGQPELAAAADRHVDNVHKQITALASNKSRHPVHSLMRKPPADPWSCAAFLTAADSFIADADLGALRERIKPFTDAAAATDPRAWYYLRTDARWPDALRESHVQTVGGFRVPARPGKRRPLPTRVCRYQAANVPQRLFEDWRQHLPDADAVAEKHLHRAMALKLVELASGDAWSRAAEFLGIPRKRAEHAVLHVRGWMTSHGRHRAFDAAAEKIAQSLDATDTLIDYAKRRHALKDWDMPMDHWQLFTDELRQRTRSGRGHWHKIDESKRVIVSAHIWTLVTHGELSFAPLVLADKKAHAGQPRTARLLRNAGELHYPLKRNPTAYATIRGLSLDYVSGLAKHIDHRGSATGFAWTPTPPNWTNE